MFRGVIFKTFGSIIRKIKDILVYGKIKMQKKGSYDRFVTVAYLFISALFASQHVSV